MSEATRPRALGNADRFSADIISLLQPACLRLFYPYRVNLAERLDETTQEAGRMQMKWRLLAPSQHRTARASLRWPQAELARRAQVAQTTVRDFENSRHRLHRSTEKLIVTALVEARVIFTSDPDAGFDVFRQFTDDDTILKRHVHNGQRPMAPIGG